MLLDGKNNTSMNIGHLNPLTNDRKTESQWNCLRLQCLRIRKGYERTAFKPFLRVNSMFSLKQTLRFLYSLRKKYFKRKLQLKFLESLF